MSVICVYAGPNGQKIEQETASLDSCINTKLRKLRREIAAEATQNPSDMAARLLADIDSYSDGKMSASLSGLIFTIRRDGNGFYIFKADQNHWSIRFYSDCNSEFMADGKPTNKLILRMERDRKRAEKAFKYAERNS